MQNLIWETKAPDTVLSYIVDWNRWLASGDTIATVDWDVDNTSGLVIESSTNTKTTATVVLSGGTNGETGYVGCQITTVNGESERKIVRMLIRN